MIELRFPSINKASPVEADKIEPQDAEAAVHENTPVPVPLETPPAMDMAARLQENQREVARTLAAHGIPLVLRSEQVLTLDEDLRREVESRLEENKKIMETEQGRQVEEPEDYLLRAANFYHLTGRTKNAIEFYESLLKKGPAKMAVLNNKGVVLDASGRHDEALEFFNEALSRAPENVHVLSNKGISLYKNEKYQQALECFDAALKVDATYINALTFKAHCLYRLGKNSEALEFYNKVIRIDNSNAEALYNKACLCSLKGDIYGAITSLEKAIRLDPSWKEAAKQDGDLDRIRENPRFRNVVGQ